MHTIECIFDTIEHLTKYVSVIYKKTEAYPWNTIEDNCNL